MLRDSRRQSFGPLARHRTDQIPRVEPHSWASGAVVFLAPLSIQIGASGCARDAAKLSAAKVFAFGHARFVYARPAANASSPRAFARSRGRRDASLRLPGPQCPTQSLRRSEVTCLRLEYERLDRGLLCPTLYRGHS